MSSAWEVVCESRVSPGQEQGEENGIALPSRPSLLRAQVLVDMSRWSTTFYFSINFKRVFRTSISPGPSEYLLYIPVRRYHREEKKKVFMVAFGYISSFAACFSAVFCECMYVYVCVLVCTEVCLCGYVCLHVCMYILPRLV